jgi:hypothetical protein
MRPGAQSLLIVQVPGPHKPPAQTFPQPSKQSVLHVVGTQGARAPDEPLPAVMPDPKVMPPMLVPESVPLARPPQPKAARRASVDITGALRIMGVNFDP